MLTQDEWNEKQRAERKFEFSWKYEGTSNHKSNSSDFENVDEDDNDDDEMVGPSLDMFLATNNPNKQSTITSKSFKRPIHNELEDEPVAKTRPSYDDDSNDDDELNNIPLPSEPRKGAEVAPPPTYEYYGPSGRGQRAKDNFVSVNEMQDSISKGISNANSRNKPRKIRGIVDDDD